MLFPRPAACKNCKRQHSLENFRTANTLGVPAAPDLPFPNKNPGYLTGAAARFVFDSRLPVTAMFLLPRSLRAA